MREEFLPFARPDIGEAEVQEVVETLRSGWITTGPKTQEFERAFADAVGASHAVALSSCTAAMHLALEALGLQPGDEVITTPYTFAATAEVIRYFDARPVFVDVRPDDLTIDPDGVAEAVTERTRAILPVHIAGLPAEMDALAAVAERHDLPIVEDAAHAFPTRYRGRTVGSLSTATCFSFYATKTLTTGEGGMLTTEDAELAARCRSMALHGLSQDAWKRYDQGGSWFYEIVAPGFKYNLSDLASALGLVQLRRSESMAERRREIAARYHDAFADEPALQPPHDREDATHAWHLYMLRLNLDRLDVARDRFIDLLTERRIGSSVHFIPLHVHPYYRETYGYRPEDFPVAHGEYLREISLPIHSRMTDGDVEDVVEAVLETAHAHGRVQRVSG